MEDPPADPGDPLTLHLRWLQASDYPDAASIREFFAGDLSEAQSLLHAADAVLRAHDLTEERGGLSADTLAAARLGTRWILGDLAVLLREQTVGHEAPTRGPREPDDPMRIVLAVTQAVAFAETTSDRVRRFLIQIHPPR